MEMPGNWVDVENSAKQVDNINPAKIHEAAGQFKTAGENAGGHTADLGTATAALNAGIWDGPAADQFFGYVEEVKAQGVKVQDRLDEASTKLTDMAGNLERIKGLVAEKKNAAKGEIDGINKKADADIAASQQREAEGHAAPQLSPQQIHDDALKQTTQIATDAHNEIKGLLGQANDSITQAQAAMKTEIDGLGKVQPPGGGSGTAPSHTGGLDGGSGSSGGSSGGGGGSGGGGSDGGGSGGGGGASGGMGSSGGPPSSGPPPGNVDSWIREAIKILKESGIPVTEDNIDEIWTIIEKESGGDPHAINNWDSNAEKGTPSKGLMQCIDPTFDAHKLPGHDDIYNPVDNIIAGVRYTFDRYGGFEGHPGLESMSGGGGYQGY